MGSPFQEGLEQPAALQLIISCCQEMYIMFLLRFFFPSEYFLCNLAQPVWHWTTAGKVTSIHMWTEPITMHPKALKIARKAS